LAVKAVVISAGLTRDNWDPAKTLLKKGVASSRPAIAQQAMKQAFLFPDRATSADFIQVPVCVVLKDIAISYQIPTSVEWRLSDSFRVATTFFPGFAAFSQHRFDMRVTL